MLKIILMAAGMLASAAHAKDISFLFIGDSYTFYPQTEDNPGLPLFVKNVTESIDPQLHVKYVFSTHPGFSYGDHMHDPGSLKLMGGAYDHVVLQGYSMESLRLTPWMEQNGTPDLTDFETYLPQVLKLVLKHNHDVTFFVNWVWNRNHPMLQDGFPGLVFPAGTPRAGQKWCGNDKYEYQRMIDDSYQSHTAGYPVRLAFVGSSWLELEDSAVASETDLYQPDWTHPAPLGSLVAALVFVRDILHLDIRKNKFFPTGVQPAQGQAVAKALVAPMNLAWFPNSR